MTDEVFPVPAEWAERALMNAGGYEAAMRRVETDPELIAKAAAGATRIRLRSATNFTSYDRQQLIEHEASCIR